jgi:hypothetical protein
VEVLDKRLTQIEVQRNLPDDDPDKTTAESVLTVESTSHVFRTENPMSMPCYTLGEKQVAEVKYENSHYYGKLIEAIDIDGWQRTTVELLRKDWMRNNTDEPF